MALNVGSGPLLNSQTEQESLALGSWSPELAMAQQNRSRRQQIANLLMQRGLEAPQGQMAGRFYVRPSWTQGLAQLAQAAMGAGLTYKLGKEQEQEASDIKANREGSIKAYMEATNPQTVQRPVPLQGPGAPQPILSPQDFDHLRALGNSEEALASRAADNKQEGPQPTTTESVQMPVDPLKARQAVASAMTNQDPYVRNYASLMERQKADAEEKAAKRTFEAQQTLEKQKFQAQENDKANQAKIEAAKERAANLVELLVLAGVNKDAVEEYRAKKQKELAQMEDEFNKKNYAAQTEVEVNGEIKKAVISRGGNVQIVGNAVPKAGSGKQEEQKQEGIQQMNEHIAELRDLYGRLNDKNAITNTDKSGLSNFAAGIGSSEVGQATGKLFGTKAQSDRNRIEAIRSQLMTSVMKATGMTSKQLDSNVELKLWLKAATDPTLDYQSNMAALDHLEKTYLNGAKPVEPAAPNGGTPPAASSNSKIIDFSELPK